MLLSIPFYNISKELWPTYVTLFSVTGTPSPQFKLGDTIQISISANNTFGAYMSFDNQLCGALIATPAVNPSPYVPYIYNNPLPRIAYEGSEIYSSPASQVPSSIGLAPAIPVTAKTMLTGFLIENIGSPSGVLTQLQFIVYNQTLSVLTINIQCTLPEFNANSMRPLYIPFSYASQQNNTTANATAIQYIAFSGTQNPIFEIGSNVSFQLASLLSNVTYKYNSAGSPNVSTFVSSAYGTAMLANTNLAVTASVTPVQILSNPKTIQFTSTTTPANVGSAITYTSPISGSVGSVNSSTGVLTVNVNNYLGRAMVNASQAATSLYNPATASASVDVIGYASTNIGNIGTNTGSVEQSMYNSGYSAGFTGGASGYFIDVNMPMASTTITGISFQYRGRMYSSSSGNTTTMIMTLSRSNNPTVAIATTTFTYNANYDTFNDGTLCIIPFVNGNAFNDNTYPITIRPTTILSVSGSMSTNDALTFNAGDAIRITLINQSNPQTTVYVYTATASNQSTLACSVISTVTASSYPYATSLFSYAQSSTYNPASLIPGGGNNNYTFPSTMSYGVIVTFPPFNNAIIATGMKIPVIMTSPGSYSGQLVLLNSFVIGAILIIDFTIVTVNPYQTINLELPFNMPIGVDQGTKKWAENQYYTRDGGYYISNVSVSALASYSYINNGLVNISSNPRLGQMAASGNYHYIWLAMSTSFNYLNSSSGGSGKACYLYGMNLKTPN